MMTRFDLTDEQRMERLPAWARELIGAQKSKIASLQRDVTELKEANDQFVAANEDDNDTVLISDRTVLTDGSDAPDMLLGKGRTIRFGDRFNAQWNGNGLEITGDRVINIVPIVRNMIEVR
jgi:hypothetical protein